MPDPGVVLEAHDLGYAYSRDRFAVRHLSLTLNRGEILGLLGRNGAGKTTTVRLLTTLLPPTEGSAIVLGHDVRTGGRALRARLGVVLQAESLDFVTVERNLTLYAFLWGVEREVAKARAEELLELFELGEVRRRKPWALSGGERRRFQVARELMHDMEILFLDEPTVGLDALARRRILRYLAERARAGLSIVFTTHILHEADLLCDRVAVMHEGTLVALDTAEALKHRFAGAREISVTFVAPVDTSTRRWIEEDLRREGATLLALDTSTDALRRIAFTAENVERFLPWIADLSRRTELRVERLSVEEPTLEGAFLGMVGTSGGAEGDNGPRSLGREPPDDDGGSP